MKDLITRMRAVDRSKYLWILRILKYTVIAACIWFIGNSVAANYDRIRTYDFSVRPLPLLLAALLYAGYTLFMSVIWHEITRASGMDVSLKDSIWLWHLPLLGKYSPGKMLLFGGRLYLYNREGHSKKQYLGSFILENYLAMAAGMAVILGLVRMSIPCCRQ